MFVTSDIFDLAWISERMRFCWRENLLCGLGVHGAVWPSYESGARFLIEAARCRGLLDEMRWASYSRPGDTRSHEIKLKSFLKLQDGGLAGAREADALILRGERPAVGVRRGGIIFGGVIDAASPRVDGETVRTDPRGYDADFLFPITAKPIDDTCELLRLAVQTVQAEYGYGFVRDEMCFPMAYCQGMSSTYGEFTERGRGESEEIHAWRRFTRGGHLWSGPWPLLRDLYEVNLISERHTTTPIDGLGYLLDWIGGEPNRGRLENIGEGRWLWILTDMEVLETRPLLYEAGLLFSYQSRVYRDLGAETGARPARRLGFELPAS
jgi:hypothetical protein